MNTEDIGKLHINQFDVLFKKGILSNVVTNTFDLQISKFRLSFEDIEIHKPFLIPTAKNQFYSASNDRRLLPKDCRERNLTYGGRIFIKMKLLYKDRVLYDEFRDSGVFPIMVKSSMCHLSDCDNIYELGDDPNEPGGYFIISGYDKLIRFHIAPKRNYLYAVKKKSKDRIYTDYYISIRSVADDEIGQKYELKYCADGNIHMKIYYRKRAYMIPIVLILRALVNCTDQEIFQATGSDQRVLTILAKMKDFPCYSQKEALDYLGSRFNAVTKISDVQECGQVFIRKILLPGLDSPSDKYNLLIEGIKKLFRCYDNKIHPDDIDNPANFELYTEAQLIPLCIREKLDETKRAFAVKIANILKNKVSTTDSTTSLTTSETIELTGDVPDFMIDKVKKAFDALDFDVGLKIKKLLSNGSLTTNACSDLLQNNGFSIIAERINIWRFASHFESVSRGAFFSNLKITSIRKLRPEGWGFFCPLNTPDGPSCGLLSHLTRSCFVSDISDSFDYSILYDYGLVLPTRGYNPGVPVFYNSRLMGTIEVPQEFVRSVRNYRSKNNLVFEIIHEYGAGIDECVYIFDSISSLYRKVYNLQSQRAEWIGIKEQVFLNISLAQYNPTDSFSSYEKDYARMNDEQLLKEGFEYREIENLNMFSTIGACIPFADHNPGPRNIYQCQMAKQAMGIACINQKFRTDNKNFFIHYLQSPMVKSSGYSVYERYPIGFNCVVAVLSYTAYDMEDAVVINKSAHQRGLFSSFIYKTEKFELEKNSYIDFTPFVGAKIETDDLLVRYSHPDFGTKTIKYHGGEACYVDNVRIFSNETPCVTITLRILRGANIGDKFCSRHGQKGVCSMLWPEIDMPFTEQGLRPDIIINPHAFPSRMTIGMLLESMCGKVAMAKGEAQDATPFLKKNIFHETKDGQDDITESQNIGEELKKYGFNYYGNEPMYSGVTGTEFQTDIFIGTVYYQRLRHMVNDKFQVRTSGAVVATTHQPVGGRKNKGGVRFGEMEKDALVSHGTSFCLKDRLMNCSDKTEFSYCCDCQSILFTQKHECSCGSKNIKIVVLPYVFKYLCCELLAMNIKLALEF